MNKPLSFTEQIIKKSTEPFHFIKSTDVNGHDCYHILMAPKAKMDALLKADSDHVDLAEYGKVVASEFGHKPSQSVIDMLKDKYGIEFYSYFNIAQ